MLLGFGQAMGRFFGYPPADLGEAMRLGLNNPGHPDLVELFQRELDSESPKKDDLDEELPTIGRYLALFEALSWGVSLDSRLSADWPCGEIQYGQYWCDEFAGGGLIRGLRYARNAVHHDWSLALDANPFETIFQARMELLWLCWSEDLSARRSNPSGERAYQQYLAGRVVGDTLLEIDEIFCAAVGLTLGQFPASESQAAQIKRSADDLYVPDALE